MLTFAGSKPMGSSLSETAKTVVRRNTEEVQGGGNFELFEKLFADNFIDHTPQPNMAADKAGVRVLYHVLRAAFPDFHAEIHWQTADGDRDDVQDLSWDAQRYFPRRCAHWSKDPIRGRRRHESAELQDYRALGRGKSFLAHAATRRLATKKFLWR